MFVTTICFFHIVINIGTKNFFIRFINYFIHVRSYICTIFISVIQDKRIKNMVKNFFPTYNIIFLCTLKVVHIYFFLQWTVASVIFRLYFISKLKRNPLLIITETLYIHEHVPSFKIFVYCFSQWFFPIIVTWGILKAIFIIAGP